VGINTIVTAIQTDGLKSVTAVGNALQAGANCGSFRSEIADLLVKVRQAQTQAKEAAE
jgi:assimilatory nitrate reductase catalytic subunit